MSFETDVKKLQKMWEATQGNKILLQNAQNIQYLIKNNLNDLLPNNFNVDAITDIGGDYQEISILMTNPYQVSGFNWTITKTLPEVWIPNVRIDIGYNFTGSDSAFENVSSYFNKVLQITPVPNQAGIVTATWTIGLYYVSYNPLVLLPSFQAKLYFVLIDPSTAY